MVVMVRITIVVLIIIITIVMISLILLLCLAALQILLCAQIAGSCKGTGSPESSLVENLGGDQFQRESLTSPATSIESVSGNASGRCLREVHCGLRDVHLTPGRIQLRFGRPQTRCQLPRNRRLWRRGREVAEALGPATISQESPRRVQNCLGRLATAHRIQPGFQRLEDGPREAEYH